MPIYVVRSEKNLEDLASTLLKARTSKAARAAALTAIRDANPGLDVDRLTPGAVVMLPRLTDAKARRDNNGTDPVVADVLASVEQGLVDLSHAADVGEQQRRADREEVEGVVGSPELKRLMARSPELKQTVAELRNSVDEDERAAEQQRADLAESLEVWQADLAALSSFLT